jgi:hypothetical protein
MRNFRKFNRTQMILIILVGPILLTKIVALVVNSLLILMVVKMFHAGLVSLWFYTVLNSANEINPGRDNNQWMIKIMLLFAIISPSISIISNHTLKLTVLFSFISGSLVMIFLVSRKFAATLATKGIVVDAFLIFFSFLIWPIAVWRYQNLLKEWAQ